MIEEKVVRINRAVLIYRKIKGVWVLWKYTC